MLKQFSGLTSDRDIALKTGQIGIAPGAAVDQMHGGSEALDLIVFGFGDLAATLLRIFGPLVQPRDVFAQQICCLLAVAGLEGSEDPVVLLA